MLTIYSHNLMETLTSSGQGCLIAKIANMGSP